MQLLFLVVLFLSAMSTNLTNESHVVVPDVAGADNDDDATDGNKAIPKAFANGPPVLPGITASSPGHVFTGRQASSSAEALLELYMTGRCSTVCAFGQCVLLHDE